MGPRGETETRDLPCRGDTTVVPDGKNPGSPLGWDQPLGPEDKSEGRTLPDITGPRPSPIAPDVDLRVFGSFTTNAVLVHDRRGVVPPTTRGPVVPDLPPVGRRRRRVVPLRGTTPDVQPHRPVRREGGPPPRRREDPEGPSESRRSPCGSMAQPPTRQPRHRPGPDTGLDVRTNGRRSGRGRRD